MPAQVIKQRVRDSFDRAAGSYDQAAVVQRRICDRLREELARRLPASSAPRVLDAGCGTGYGARQLRLGWPAAQIIGVDFAPAMLALAKTETHGCLASDIEKLPVPDATFDLWWSSLAIQWCNNDKVFAEAARILKPNGQIAFSTLGPDTFKGLREAFAHVDSHRHTLSFSDPDDIEAALRGAGFRDVCLLREKHAVHYPDLKSLLQSVKAIGAQNVGEGGRSGMLGRQAWKKIEAAYESHREAAGLPASYDVILGFATK